MALPERFLKADRDAPCEGCQKVRKTCRYCERCRSCCNCPICYHCQLAEISACDEFAEEVGGSKYNTCRCEWCPDCKKLFDPDTGGWEHEGGVGPMFCGKCLAKRDKVNAKRVK